MLNPALKEIMMLIKEGKSNAITGIHECFFVGQSLSAEP